MLNGKSDKRPGKRRKQAAPRSDPPPLKNSPDWAFVVQFNEPTEPGSVRLAGRAEHVMSGQNSNFETPDELVEFFRRVMNQLNPRSPKKPDK